MVFIVDILFGRAYTIPFNESHKRLQKGRVLCPFVLEYISDIVIIFQRNPACLGVCIMQ